MGIDDAPHPSQSVGSCLLQLIEKLGCLSNLHLSRETDGAASEQRAAKDYARDRKVDYEARYIDERGDEWRACARGVEAETTENERQQRTGERAEGDDADEASATVMPTSR